MLSNGKCSVAKFDHLGRSHQFPHPPMHDSKAMSFAILMADAFGRPTADGIDDVGRAFNGTEAIAQTVPKGVDDASIWHSWLQPFV